MNQTTADSLQIGLVGLSHLGIVTGIGLASRGFCVRCYDPDAARVAEINAGKLPIYEPQLEGLLTQHRNHIEFSSTLETLRDCSVIYLARDVPTDAHNVSDLKPILALLDSLVPALPQAASLVIHCQVSPGFTRKLAGRLLQLERQDIKLLYQVETLIFGCAVERALRPERYIVGCAQPEQALPEDYQRILAAPGCPILAMRYESAELAKIAINLFLVSTLSTAGFLAEICEQSGADWREIAPALRLDKRIGPHAYLQPGLGFAGGNLERDVVTVLSLAAEFGCEPSIAKAWLLENEYRKNWVLRLLQREVYNQLPDAKLAIWGLTYKPDTHSLKNSPALALLEHLHSKTLSVFDPRASLEGLAELGQKPSVLWRQAQNALDCLRNADALVVLTAWPEFSKLALSDVATLLSGKTVIDPLGVLDESCCHKLGLHYFRMGARSA